MAKTKDTPALFELIGQQGMRPGQPPRKPAGPPLEPHEDSPESRPPAHAAPHDEAHLAAGPELVVEPAPAEPAVAEHLPAAPEAAQDSSAGPAGGVAVAEPRAAAEPLVRPEGNRLRFSITTVALAAVIFFVLLSLLAAFELGRHLGYDAGRVAAIEHLQTDGSGSELRAAMQQDPQPDVLEDLDQVDRRVEAEAAMPLRVTAREQGVRLEGLNYIWVDRFTTPEAAEAARQYLASHGIECTAEASQNQWILITVEGFDYRIPQERQACDTLADTIRDLGQAYLKAGGRYRFDCFVNKKKPGDTW